jgi:dipeptidyl aminopeptidase/acylaminoacyl peptidase
MILRIQQKLRVLICLSLLATTGQANEALVDQYGSLPTYRSFAISPNGKHYAFIHRQGEDDRFIIMDAATNKLVGGFNAGDFKARSIAFVSDDYVILKASNSQRKSGFWGQWENSGALAYHLKTGKINRLLDGTRELHPAQTGLGIIVAIDPERDLAYMPAFTDNRGSDTSYDLYEVKLKTGYGKLHARGSSSTVDWFVDSKDGQVLAREDYREKSQEHRVYSKVTGRWQLIYQRQSAVPEIALQGLSGDGQQLLFVNESGDRQAVFAMSLQDGRISGPLYQRSDADAQLLLDINRQLQGVRYTGLKPEYDFARARETQLFVQLNKMFNHSTVSLESATADRTQLIISVSGADAAVAYKKLDSRSLQLSDLAVAYPDIDAIGPITPFHYQARDGLAISAVLTEPVLSGRGEGRVSDTATKAPLIVLPHGGPHSHDRLSFDWMAQYFSRLGYVVLQPNFRGSTGFGYAFRDAGDGEWGKAMQDDISDGIKALVEAGRVDPARVCIVGVSYGGYAALAGGAFSPQLYRCIVAIAGVSDVSKMFIKDRNRYGYRHWLVSYWSQVLGDANSSTAPLKAISPLNFVKAFQAPVLLIHGKDDTVVPIEQSKLMAKALRKAGKPVELLALRGEDHYLSSSVTRRQALEAMGAFVLKHNPPGEGD